jgi:lysine-specific permease
LLATSSLSGYVIWVGIALAHLQFRRAFVKQGHDFSELPYKAGLFPFGPIFALIVSIIVICGQDFDSFIHFDWQSILISYINIPIVLLLYLYYKIRYKTKWIPLDEILLTRVGSMGKNTENTSSILHTVDNIDYTEQ